MFLPQFNLFTPTPEKFASSTQFKIKIIMTDVHFYVVVVCNKHDL